MLMLHIPILLKFFFWSESPHELIIFCDANYCSKILISYFPIDLVIGGTSFVGYHVILRLSERGEVVVLDEFKKKPNSWQKLRAQELSTKKSKLYKMIYIDQILHVQLLHVNT